MENNSLAQNQVHQNPNNVPYQLRSYPQNQAPDYYPSADTPYPPPGFQLQLVITMMPHPPNANPEQPGAEALNSTDVTLPTATTQVRSDTSVHSAPNKTKVVQSHRCEVCKIDCNSKDVLDNHVLGKKHRKKLDRLTGPPIVPTIQPAAPSIVPAFADSIEPAALAIAPASLAIPKEPKSKSAKKRKAASMDLESKRQKVLEEGAAPKAIKTCTYCNVVCNSEVVLNSHNAGHRHAVNVKRDEILKRGDVV